MFISCDQILRREVSGLGFSTQYVRGSVIRGHCSQKHQHKRSVTIQHHIGQKVLDKLNRTKLLSLDRLFKVSSLDKSQTRTQR